MAITIALSFAGKNRLRYLMTVASSGADSGSITTTGAATPDVQTDSAGGQLETIAKVITQGYGPYAAGAQTQAKARALFLSDRPSSGFTPGATLGPTGGPATAMCKITRRTGNHSWFVDADVSAGNPVLLVTTVGDGVVANGTAVLEVFIPGAIGA
jgi:hypothetical protein